MSQISVKWAGYDDLIQGAEYVNSLGTAPGQITINLITPENLFSPDDVSDLILIDGRTRITIKNCRVVNIQSQKSSSGFLKTVTLEDGRWKWRFGYINGKYNQFLPDGTVDIPTDTDLTGLVAELLVAMKEIGKTEGLGKLDKISRPSVDWDYALPSAELESLLGDFGKAIAYGLDGSVSIVKLGEARGTKSKADAQDLPEDKNILISPTKLTLVGKRDLRQGDFELEAVAIDSDGAIKPLADLSYFDQLAGSDLHFLLGITKEEDRERARKSLYRYYRIKNTLTWDSTRSANNPLGAVPAKLKKSGTKKWQLENLLPLPGKLVEFGKEDAVAQEREFEIRGEFYDVENNRTVARDASQNWPQVKVSYNLDLDTGLIKFNQPIRKLNNGVYEAAKLYIRTAIETLRYEKTKTIGGPGDTTKIIIDEALGLGFVDGKATVENAKVIKFAEERLKAKKSEYKSDTKQGSVKLIGLHPIELDGVTRQVTYTVNSSGANTTYSNNNEHDRHIPSFEQKETGQKSEKQVREIY